MSVLGPDDCTGSNSMYEYPTSRLLSDEDSEKVNRLETREQEWDNVNSKKLSKSHSSREGSNKWTLGRKHSISTMEPKYHSDEDPKKTPVTRTFSLKKLGTVIFGRRNSNENPVENEVKVSGTLKGTARLSKESPPMPNQEEKDSSSDTSTKTPSSSGSPSETPPDSRDISPSKKKTRWYRIKRDTEKSPTKSRRGDISPARDRQKSPVRERQNSEITVVNPLRHTLVIQKGLRKTASYEVLRLFQDLSSDQKNIQKMLMKGVLNGTDVGNERIVEAIYLIINNLSLSSEDKKNKKTLDDKKSDLFTFCFRTCDYLIDFSKDDQFRKYVVFLDAFITKFKANDIVIKSLASSFQANQHVDILLNKFIEIGTANVGTEDEKANNLIFFNICYKILPYFDETYKEALPAILDQAVQGKFNPESNGKIVEMLDRIISGVRLTKEERQKKVVLEDKKSKLFSTCIDHLNHANLDDADEFDKFMTFMDIFFKKISPEELEILLKHAGEFFQKKKPVNFFIDNLIDKGLHNPASKTQNAHLFSAYAFVFSSYKNKHVNLRNLISQANLDLRNESHAAFLKELFESSVSWEDKKIYVSSIINNFSEVDVFQLMEILVKWEMKTPSTALRLSTAFSVMLIKGYIENAHPRLSADIVQQVIKTIEDKKLPHLFLERSDQKEYEKLKAAELEKILNANKLKFESLFSEVLAKLHEMPLPSELLGIMKMLKEQSKTAPGMKDDPTIFAFQFYFLFFINPAFVSEEIKKKKPELLQLLKSISIVLQKLISQDADKVKDSQDVIINPISKVHERAIASLVIKHNDAHYQYMMQSLAD